MRVGHTKFDAFRRPMTAARRARIDAIKQKMLDEMELYQLRQLGKVPQAELARRMKTAQGAISRLERQQDMLVSTLRAYVQAIGGQLQISAKVGGQMIKLRRLGTSTKKRRKIASRVNS